jgi:VWFA-related protein
MRGFGADVVRTMAVVIMLSAFAFAQQQPTFTARRNLVPVPTLVKDASGNAVYGLEAKDFVVEDDGVEQAIRLDEAPDAPNISLVIAVETGRRAFREFGRMAGLAAMLDPILSRRGNDAALILFDSKVKVAEDFISRADLIEDDLKNLPPGDHGAAIVDAVAHAAKMLESRPVGNRRVLLLISETRDQGSRTAKLEDAVRMIEQSNALVYALPFSPYISQQIDVARGANREEWGPTIDFVEKAAAMRQAMRRNAAKTLATLTGGEYEMFMTRKEFETRLLAFSNHLESRYLLSFEPEDPHPGLHRIRVRLRLNGVETLTYRKVYWAGE